MEIRLATEKDINTLAEMRWELRTEVHPGKITCTKDEFLDYCRQFLLRRMMDDRWVLWVAEEQDQVISQLFVQIVEKVPRPGRFQDAWGYVTNVYTLPERRNQGIGSQLLQKVVEWAKEKDLELLILWPSEQSIPFYERAGFTSTNIIMECILREEEI